MYCIKNKGRTRTLHTFQFLHNIKENMPRFQGLLSFQTRRPSFKLVQVNLRSQGLRVQNPVFYLQAWIRAAPGRSPVGRGPTRRRSKHQNM